MNNELLVVVLIIIVFMSAVFGYLGYGMGQDQVENKYKKRVDALEFKVGGGNDVKILGWYSQTGTYYPYPKPILARRDGKLLRTLNGQFILAKRNKDGRWVNNSKYDLHLKIK